MLEATRLAGGSHQLPAIAQQRQRWKTPVKVTLAQASSSSDYSKGNCVDMDIARGLVRVLCMQHGLKADLLLGKLTLAIVEAQGQNKSCGLRGSVRCGRSWRGQKLEEMPHRGDSISIFVSKGKGQFGNAFSPFCMDVPVDMMKWATADGKPDGKPLPLPQKLELVWQAAKKAVGESWEAYFSRRERIYSGRTPKRRYLERGTAIEGACFGSAEHGLIQYVPSRVFYCNAYERTVASSSEFNVLKELVDAGFNFVLLGPDGHPVETSQGAVAEAYADASLQFGHERVLLAMLRGETPWADEATCWQTK